MSLKGTKMLVSRDILSLHRVTWDFDKTVQFPFELKYLLLKSTVWMKILTIISGILRFLHHYWRNFDHLLALKNLVVEFLMLKYLHKKGNE